MRWLDAAYLSALGVTLPYWLARSAQSPSRRAALMDRFRGRCPRPSMAQSVVWMHGVSLGETSLLAPLIRQLQSARQDLNIVVSATTPTGLSYAEAQFHGLTVFPSPLDFSWSIRRVMDRIRPSLLILAEQELWPNMLLEATRRRIAVAVVNARMSDRSFHRYRRAKRVMKAPLAAVRWWGAQDERDAQRLAELTQGASTTIQVTGSIKFDGALTERDNQRTNSLRQLIGWGPDARIVCAGSTMHPEEEIVVDTWKKLHERSPALRLIVVPRHPERFNAVAALLESRRIPFQRRSTLSSESPSRAPVLLWDAVGELAGVWGLADMGFVGGSLECRRGGQNMIEPAGYGVPCCFGPNTWNFRDIAEKLVGARGAMRVRSRLELLATWQAWLKSPEEAAATGSLARQLVIGQQGAVARTIKGLEPFLPPTTVALWPPPKAFTSSAYRDASVIIT